MQGPEREQLIAFLDSVEDAVVTLDASWKLTYLNRAAKELLGLEGRDSFGVVTDEVLVRSEGHRFRDAFLRARDEQRPTYAEAWVPALKGWYEADVYPAAGSLTVIFRETTQRRRRELVAGVRDAVAEALDPDAGPIDTLVTLARELRRVLGIEAVEVWRHDRRAGGLRLAGTDAVDDPGLEAFRAASANQLLSDGSAPWRALVSRAPEVVLDVTDPGQFRRHGTADAAELRTALYLPMVVEGSPTTVLGLLSRRDIDAEDRLEVLLAVHPALVELVTRQRERHDLARFMTLATDMLVVTSFDGYLKRANPRWIELLGGSYEELLDRPFEQLIAPEDRDGIWRALEALREGAPLQGVRTRHRLANGETRTLSWNLHPVPSERLIYGAARDVTVELRERAIEDVQRAVLRRIILGDPSAVTFVTLTAALEARFPGSRAAAVVGEEATTGQEAPTWSAPLVGVEGERLGSFHLHQPPDAIVDGAEEATLVDLVRVASLAVVRERAEEQLRRSEGRLQLVAQATSDAIWDWDPATDELAWGQGFATLFGYDLTAEQPTVASWSVRIHEEDRDRVLEGIHRALDGDTDTWVDSYRFLRADGTVAWVTDRGAILRDDEGRAVRMVGGMVDETERRQLELRVRQAQRLESLGTVMGGLAHDLNNVLAPIMMAADMLATVPMDTEDAELVDTIVTSTRRGAGMLREVLAFARGDTIDRTVLDPKDLLIDLEQAVTDLLPPSVTFEVLLDGDVGRVEGDADQLLRVALNLVLNAREAMPEGGTITVTLSEEALANAEALPAGRYVRLEVRDTGSGMSEGVLSRLFEPFFSTKPPEQGTGLGLFTAQAIVVAHLGTIEATSELGRGSTFVVRLPVHEG